MCLDEIVKPNHFGTLNGSWLTLTGMPGPIVEDRVQDKWYSALTAAGLASFTALTKALRTQGSKQP